MAGITPVLGLTPDFSNNQPSPSASFAQPAGVPNQQVFGPPAPPSVLGASTQNVQPTGGTQTSGGQQTPGGGYSAGYKGPATQTNPQAPDTSVFDQIINPVIQNFESLIGQQQTASQNQIGGLNAQRQNELDQSTADTTAQTQGLNTQTTNQTNQANNAIEEAKRMYSEMSQGIEARYGTTTNTGGFLTEQLGQQTGRNIATLHQGLTSALQDIGDKMSQVKATGELAIRGINTQFDTAIQTEQDNLQKYITQIRGNEAMLQSNKAQMAAQAIQKYQDTVNNLNAQREQQSNAYAIAAMNAQTQLQIYGQRGQAMLTQVQQGAPNYSGIGNNLQYGPGSITNSGPVAPTTTQDTGSQILNPNQNNNVFGT